MKVTFTKEDEKSGLIFKTNEYALYLQVELSPEERAAVQKLGISDYVLMEYSYKGLELNYQVKSLVYASDKGGKGSRFVAPDAVVRNRMEGQLMEQLKALKSQISAQMAGGSGSQTFEL